MKLLRIVVVASMLSAMLLPGCGGGGGDDGSESLASCYESYSSEACDGLSALSGKWKFSSTYGDEIYNLNSFWGGSLQTSDHTASVLWRSSGTYDDDYHYFMTDTANDIFYEFELSSNGTTLTGVAYESPTRATYLSGTRVD